MVTAKRLEPLTEEQGVTVWAGSAVVSSTLEDQPAASYAVPVGANNNEVDWLEAMFTPVAVAAVLVENQAYVAPPRATTATKSIAIEDTNAFLRMFFVFIV